MFSQWGTWEIKRRLCIAINSSAPVYDHIYIVTTSNKFLPEVMSRARMLAKVHLIEIWEKYGKKNIMKITLKLILKIEY